MEFEEITTNDTDYQTNSINKANSKVQYWFIAQEVEETMKEINFPIDVIDKPQHEKDHYKISHSQFVVPLVKAVQEQQAQIEALKKENNLLKVELQNEIRELKKLIIK